MSRNEPLRVSIIVPSYNTAQYIGGTLESIFAQTFHDFEVIVVNDGSPDTPALERAIGPFRERIRYLEQPNGGLAAARNAAIRVARGSYVALLDSDDEWEPEYLSVQVAALEADPTLDVVYPNARIVGDHPHAGRTYMDVCPSRGPVTIESLVTERCNVFVSVLMRRGLFDRAGLFDASFRSVEDFEFWLRVLAAGGRIGYHRRPLVRFRKRRDSLSADPVWMAEHASRVLQHAAQTLPLGERDRRLLEERVRYVTATQRVAEAKRAFFKLDTDAALALLEEANRYFQSPKIALARAMLHVAPGLLLKLYDWRDRMVVGSSTRF
jgi:glycosyltransferase involved in cell wall biosynthesis